MAKTTQKKTKSQAGAPGARGRASQSEAPAEGRAPIREVAGVLFFFAGALLLYFLIFDAKSLAGAAVNEFSRAAAGSLCYALPLILGWAGILIAFSGGARRAKPSHVLLVCLLMLLAMSFVELFFVNEIMRGARLFSYGTFLDRAARYREGGAGVLGALLAWPLSRNLGTAGAAMALVALIVADLILLRKISLSRLGSRARERYDGFREEMERRSVERMTAREQRRSAPVSRPAAQAARPRDDFDGDPFAEAEIPDLADRAAPPPAPRAQSRSARGEMRIEKVKKSAPLPDEPRVEPPAEDAESSFEEDIPSFLSARKRKPKDRPAALHIKEPEPLPLKDLPIFSAAPDPDGSEIAETPRRAAARAGVPLTPETGLGEEPALFATGAEEPEAQSVLEGSVDLPPFDAEPPRAKPEAPLAEPAPIRRTRLPVAQPVPADEEEYIYPPIDLLKASQPSKVHNREQQDAEKGKKLIDTLASFGIDARMIGVAHGPTVTRFELSPAPGVKVSRITALSDDIALNLAAVSVRIEAPIPGKAAVGVEVPNDLIETVPLRDVLESQECRRHPSRLAVALGRDNAGRYIIADLAKMPHVLIAGQTGSGKSVCINCIICSILYRSSPEEVRLIMIDPKVVELSAYNGIPHLLVPVVTDPKKAAGALDWAVSEMSARYKKFADLGVRDMKGFNQHRPADTPAMPQIVIIIDELADLMMVTPGEVEDAICRLAQLARAAGIHLVIATQRPSVNVITGVIKANIPSRIAFTVASQVDSRTILDLSGAEKLLGRGDMLYAPSGQGKTRVQGAWVSDDEVHEVVEFIKVRHNASYDEDAQEHIESAELSDAEREDKLGEFDELLPGAVELVVDAEAASVSMLQRRLRVGHSRAGRLIDEMEVRGIVGPDEGSKSRKVLINREQYLNMFKEP